MSITAVYALGRIKKILTQGENGYSVVSKGGYMRTVLTMKMMLVANCVPFVEYNITAKRLFNNVYRKIHA